MKKNRILVLIMLFALVFSTEVFAASDAKERKAAKKTVVTFLKNARKYNTQKMKKTLLPRNKRNELRTYNGSSKIAKAIKYIHNSFQYEIFTVKVSGKTAKAVVFVTYCNGKTIVQSAFNDTMSYFLQNNLSYSDDLFYDKFFDYFLEEHKNYGNVNMCTVKSVIPLKKYKGKWKISKITKRMEQYINGNFIEGFKAVEKIYN